MKAGKLVGVPVLLKTGGGVLVDPSSPLSGAVYRNATRTTVLVSFTKESTGKYMAEFIPALTWTSGDIISLELNASIQGLSRTRMIKVGEIDPVSGATTGPVTGGISPYMEILDDFVEDVPTNKFAYCHFTTVGSNGEAIEPPGGVKVISVVNNNGVPMDIVNMYISKDPYSNGCDTSGRHILVIPTKGIPPGIEMTVTLGCRIEGLDLTAQKKFVVTI